MTHRCSFCAALLAASALMLAPGRAVHGETFLFTGPAGLGQTWESDPNWLGDSGEFVDKYPGQTLATDNANASGDLAGTPRGIDISSAISVVTLTLGDTNAAPSATTIGGTGSLLATNIASLGTAGAVNNIGVNLRLTGTTTFAGSSTNPLNLNGSILVDGSASQRTLRNDSSTQALNVNGPVVLSSNATAGNLLFRNNNNASVMNLAGVISDGTTPAGKVEYNRGIFHNLVDNTYTGVTSFGSNTSSGDLKNILYTDGAFGSNQINVTGGGNAKVLEGAAMSGTRTLANEIRLARSLTFAGPESFVLTGKVFQSSSRSIINNIGAGKSLTLTGTVFTDQSGTDNGRLFVFDGSGLTNVNANIDDEDLDLAATKGSVRKAGTGRVIYQKPGMVLYNRGTEVYDGVLQLGEGATAVNLNGHVAAGAAVGAATVGTLEINHGGVMDFDTSLSHNLPVNHVGSGTTTFSDVSFGSGQIKVASGTVLINGGTFNGSAETSLRSAPGGDLSIVDVLDSSILHVGQQVTGVPADPTATTVLGNGFYIAAILSPTQIALSANVNNTNGTDILLANKWNFDFNGGTGTGSANVIVDAGATVGGSGVIGGFLGANGTVAPGNSIGTLSVLGNATVNAGFDVEYDGLGAGSIDLLAVSGDLTLGAGSILDFAAIGSPADDPAYVFATYGGTLSGTFGSIVDLPSGYYIDYAFNGNSIALVQVPEPAALVLFVMAMIPAVTQRRVR